LQKQSSTERPQQEIVGIIHVQKEMQKVMNDILPFNSVNLLAVGFTMIEVESLLTLLVLVSALVYNIKKITDKNG
jgi:hypothetical protein